MTATLALTESDVLIVLRSFLIEILPSGVEVIKGQDNRVPEPKGPDFAEMTPILRERISTNVETYSDNGAGGTNTKTSRQSTLITVQVDVHGPASADNAQIISTMLRDEYAVRFFASSGVNAAPLYTSDPRQMPFMNGEQQYENRWTVDAVLQANPTVTVPQDFADQIAITTVSVVTE